MKTALSAICGREEVRKWLISYLGLLLIESAWRVCVWGEKALSAFGGRVRRKFRKVGKENVKHIFNIAVIPVRWIGPVWGKDNIVLVDALNVCLSLIGLLSMPDVFKNIFKIRGVFACGEYVSFS